MEDFETQSEKMLSSDAKKAFEALKQTEEGQKLWGAMRSQLKLLNERFFILEIIFMCKFLMMCKDLKI